MLRKRTNGYPKPANFCYEGKTITFRIETAEQSKLLSKLAQREKMEEAEVLRRLYVKWVASNGGKDIRGQRQKALAEAIERSAGTRTMPRFHRTRAQTHRPTRPPRIRHPEPEMQHLDDIYPPLGGRLHPSLHPISAGGFPGSIAALIPPLPPPSQPDYPSPPPSQPLPGSQPDSSLSFDLLYAKAVLASLSRIQPPSQPDYGSCLPAGHGAGDKQ